jgi:hypothetical protein
MYRFHDRTVSARYHMENSKMVLLLIHDLLFLPHLAVVFRLRGTMAVTSSRSCENGTMLQEPIQKNTARLHGVSFLTT